MTFGGAVAVGAFEVERTALAGLELANPDARALVERRPIAGGRRYLLDATLGRVCVVRDASRGHRCVNRRQAAVPKGTFEEGDAILAWRQQAGVAAREQLAHRLRVVVGKVTGDADRRAAGALTSARASARAARTTRSGETRAGRRRVRSGAACRLIAVAAVTGRRFAMLRSAARTSRNEPAAQRPDDRNPRDHVSLPWQSKAPSSAYLTALCNRSRALALTGPHIIEAVWTARAPAGSLVCCLAHASWP